MALFFDAIIYIKKGVLMFRVYNFAAGPAMLPESVLRKVQQDLLSWQDSGT